MPLYFQLDTLREWRKAMLLPPRTSDVYRAANQVSQRALKFEKEDR
jgi:hypothetical protein